MLLAAPALLPPPLPDAHRATPFLPASPGSLIPDPRSSSVGPRRQQLSEQGCTASEHSSCKWVALSPGSGTGCREFPRAAWMEKERAPPVWARGLELLWGSCGPQVWFLTELGWILCNRAMTKRGDREQHPGMELPSLNCMEIRVCLQPSQLVAGRAHVMQSPQHAKHPAVGCWVAPSRAPARSHSGCVPQPLPLLGHSSAGLLFLHAELAVRLPPSALLSRPFLGTAAVDKSWMFLPCAEGGALGLGQAVHRHLARLALGRARAAAQLCTAASPHC